MKDGDWVTVTEAARLLGVHRNTVRNRIKAGRYKAHKVVTPQGETYMVERESLSTSPDNDLAQPHTSGVRHNAYNPLQDVQQERTVMTEAQQVQAEALVQRLLAPFIAELGAVREELGRERQRRELLECERDALKERLEATEAHDLGYVYREPGPTSRPWWKVWRRG
jgi:excisionase family DNA binding protein